MFDVVGSGGVGRRDTAAGEERGAPAHAPVGVRPEAAEEGARADHTLRALCGKNTTPTEGNGATPEISHRNFSQRTEMIITII